MSVAASVNLQGTAGPPGGAKANGKDVLLGDADAELDFREAGTFLAWMCVKPAQQMSGQH